MANSVDPDETALKEPSHLDLHCLQRYLYGSVGIEGENAHQIIHILRNKEPVKLSSWWKFWAESTEK